MKVLLADTELERECESNAPPEALDGQVYLQWLTLGLWDTASAHLCR